MTTTETVTETIAVARRAFAAGDLTTAERYCSAVLASNPGLGSAWTLLTETALLRGRPDAAIVCAERAVALLPDDPIAHALRAKCLILAGEARAARQAATLAGQYVGDSPQALDAVGSVFGLLGEHARAAELFRRAVAARPDVPQYLFNLAANERMTGALDAAEGHSDAAIALDPRYGLAHYLRADLRTQTRDRNHVAAMSALLRDGRLDTEGEVLVRFALAKELEDLGEHGRAFEQVAAASALHRGAIRYDAKAEIAAIEAVIHTQTNEWLGALQPGFGGLDPVFVTGLPRTGTTLIERIVASHSAMTSAGETGAFAAALQRAVAGQKDRATFERRAADVTPRAVGTPAELAGHYLDSVSAYGVPPGHRFVDKTLENYRHCGLIHAVLPRAKIILVRRHPLDACWAMYKTHFRGAFAFSYDLRELAEYLLAFRRLTQHWRATLPSEVLLEVSYEEVVRDQAGVSRRIIAFLGLPWEDGVLRFHQSPAPSATASAVQIRRPIYASSVGSWRRHAERLEPVRTRLTQEIPAAELQ
jgi:tetratricopeptide (TPR) repeat protein